MIAYIIAFIVLLAADQALKAWTVSAFTAPAPGFTATSDAAQDFLPGVLDLTRVHNYGAAWSSLSGMRWLLIVVTSLLLLAVAYLLAKRIVRHPAGRWGCTLLLAGGVGNLIDRVRLGYVVDTLHFTFWPSYPVFNAADIYVVCGAILGAVYYLWLYEKFDGKDRRNGNHSSASQS